MRGRSPTIPRSRFCRTAHHADRGGKVQARTKKESHPAIAAPRPTSQLQVHTTNQEAPMARLLWPGDYEWMYLTLDLLRGRDLPTSDMDGATSGSGERTARTARC